MSERVIFLTHAEVEIDPGVPVPEWDLNAIGHARHARFAAGTEVADVTAIFSSTETKAISGAAPVAARLDLSPKAREALGENDRNATGFLPSEEFERTADAFFANPDISVRGWERAVDAQRRIVLAVQDAIAAPRSTGDVLIVSHGAVGALLRCYLARRPITREEDQPQGGGNWFAFEPDLAGPPTDWRTI